MQRRKPESFAVEYGNRSCVFDVDADFHDGRRNQHVDIARLERLHYFRLFFRFHFAVNKRDVHVRKHAVFKFLEKGFRAVRFHPFRVADFRADDKRLIAFFASSRTYENMPSFL